MLKEDVNSKMIYFAFATGWNLVSRLLKLEFGAKPKMLIEEVKEKTLLNTQMANMVFCIKSWPFLEIFMSM